MTAAPETGFKSLCVIGLGYVGLPTAAVFANRGLDVLGVDIDAATVALINAGKTHIVEPDLGAAVAAAVAEGRLKAATAPRPADAFIIAVPTPFMNDHQPDLSYIEAAAASLAPVLSAGNLVVVESTVPVGATEQLAAWLAGHRPDLSIATADSTESVDINVAHSPERVLPGHVMVELTRNDRVVGGITPLCAERTAELYGLAVDGQCLLTTARTAELVKLAENAYRDVSIAFANELSLICDRMGMDVWETVELANHHPRVNILQPGPGVGGHCIAVDPWFIVSSAPDDTTLIRAARQVNDSKPAHIVSQVSQAAAGLTSPVIACLGLAYKADIDDLRESPAIAIIRGLAEDGAGELAVVEPHVTALPDDLAGLEHVTLRSLDDALADADIVVLLTDHREFRDLDRARLAEKLLFDTRGIWR